jgi:hypothetical protein
VAETWLPVVIHKNAPQPVGARNGRELDGCSENEGKDQLWRGV